MMKLNCQKDDLAVITRSEAGNRDKIVCCVKPIGPMRVLHMDDNFTVEFIWEVDRDLARVDGKMTRLIADSCLRPIRDQPGEDEMLRRVGRPNEVDVSDGVEVLT
jgi:hypothetical protein